MEGAEIWYRIGCVTWLHPSRTAQLPQEPTRVNGKSVSYDIIFIQLSIKYIFRYSNKKILYLLSVRSDLIW